MDDRLFVGVIIGGIPEGRPENVKVMMKKETTFPFFISEVLQNDFFYVDRFLVVNNVIAVESNAEGLVGRGHMG